MHRSDPFAEPPSRVRGMWETVTDPRVKAVSRRVRRAIPEAPREPKQLKPLTWKQVLGQLVTGALIGAGVVLLGGNVSR